MMQAQVTAAFYGRTLRTARSTARGWSEDPATWDDFADKYRERSDRIRSSGQFNEALDMIKRLEQLPDVKPSMSVLRCEFDCKAWY